MVRGHVSFDRTAIGGLRPLLTQELGYPVIDKTGITGEYDLTLDWAPVQGAGGTPSGDTGQASAPSDVSKPSIFTAVQEQLGLNLEAQRGPIETLVVDHAEKPSVDGAEVTDASLKQVALEQIGASANATSVSDNLPEFEVVSLKPSDPNVGHHMGVQLSPDRLVMNFETLTGLICIAYNIPYWELLGAEPWMNRDMTDGKDHFDLEARLPQNLAPYDQRHANFEIGDERIREMMQAMLADRFHLKFHRETATGTVSLLERSGKPLLLVPTSMKYAKMYGDGYSEVGGAVEGKGRRHVQHLDAAVGEVSERVYSPSSCN